MEEYIRKLLNLINSKNLIVKVNKLKTVKDDYEFFYKNSRLFLPEEKPLNKKVDFSKLNENSDLLKLPIISIVNNDDTYSFPYLKLNFRLYEASLYKEQIKIKNLFFNKNFSKVNKRYRKPI